MFYSSEVRRPVWDKTGIRPAGRRSSAAFPRPVAGFTAAIAFTVLPGMALAASQHQASSEALHAATHRSVVRARSHVAPKSKAADEDAAMQVPVKAELPPDEVAMATGNWSQTGLASYYANAFNGRRTASGERFSQHELTAAHHFLPFGTKVLVSSPETGRQVVVTINDRLGNPNRVLDLSQAAARALGMMHTGVVIVRMLPVSSGGGG
jgi:rare lipoprotein A